MYIVRRVNTDGIVHRIEIDSESGSAEGVNPPLQPGRDDTRVVAGDFAGNLKHQLVLLHRTTPCFAATLSLVPYIPCTFSLMQPKYQTTYIYTCI